MLPREKGLCVGRIGEGLGRDEVVWRQALKELVEVRRLVS